MLAIETRHLRKEFGRKVAVADLSLQVERGEVFGFLGPNGAGKTTSVKMLLGLTSPTAGDASLLGKPLGDRQTRQKIGFLPEHFRFYHWLKASEFLDLHGKLYGMSSAERASIIPTLLNRVGLGDRADTKLDAFSKGMTQRIGLAQALINRPELVFLDEPTSGLDPIGRRLVRDIISELREQGTAVFVNSHLLSEIEKTCDRVAFIREGRILEVHTLSDFSAEAVTLTLRIGTTNQRPQLLNHLRTSTTHLQIVSKTQFELTLPNEEAIPTLAHWLTTNNYTIYELTPAKLSLEDRFLQIIGNNQT